MMTILVIKIAAAAVGLLFCFFGYRLARILLPVCGTALLFFLPGIFLPEYMSYSSTERLIISLCSIAVIYILLFMMKRTAALFTGILASAFLFLMAERIFGLGRFDMFLPIAFTVCIIAGLLSFVYRRTAVIAVTSLLGGFLTALFSIMLIVDRLSPSADRFLTGAYGFMTANAVLISAAALGFGVVSVFIQLFITGKKTVLPSKSERQKKYEIKDTAPKTGRNTFI